MHLALWPAGAPRPEVRPGLVDSSRGRCPRIRNADSSERGTWHGNARCRRRSETVTPRCRLTGSTRPTLTPTRKSCRTPMDTSTGTWRCRATQERASPPETFVHPPTVRHPTAWPELPLAVAIHPAAATTRSACLCNWAHQQPSRHPVKVRRRRRRLQWRMPSRQRRRLRLPPERMTSRRRRKRRKRRKRGLRP